MIEAETLYCIDDAISSVATFSVMFVDAKVNTAFAFFSLCGYHACYDQASASQI
jgi:hypothetical protein